jgi:hypothetical protein
LFAERAANRILASAHKSILSRCVAQATWRIFARIIPEPAETMAGIRVFPDRVLSQRERSLRWRQRRKGLLAPVPPRPKREEAFGGLLKSVLSLKTFAELLGAEPEPRPARLAGRDGA